tara:strand:- start:41 stop:1411 length:1371 start_codon:yes stop_codon:yes gene_type:complete
MKEYRDIIDAVINIPLGDYYTATNGEEEWVAHPIQYSVDHLANSILLISSDEEYKDATKLQTTPIIIDIRPEKNILLISCHGTTVTTSMIWKIIESYLKELINSSLPEPKEIYISDIHESNLGIGHGEQIFNIDFDKVHSNHLKHLDNYQLQRLGHLEQLLYRCRELTTSTLINLVNADVDLKNTNIFRSKYLNRSDRFDNYYSFPFGVLYRTKSRLRGFNAESSTMNYRMQPAKHFICMNAHPHYRRIALVNYLYKEKIVDACHLSWLPSDHNGKSIESTKLIFGEPFFDYNKVMTLDLNVTEVRSGGQYEMVDEFYYLTDSLIDIGIETISDPRMELEGNRFITEKTWKPYLFGKIGFQFNYSGYYSDLKTFGFELYDEIFDYSFDKIKDNEIRFNEYCKELKRISEIPIKDLTSQILTIEDKILNNRNHIWNYKFPMPTVLKEYPNLGIELNE